ncbi:MAG: NADH-quinone oxidoreductase subunit J [Piscirickettsiaceae bacterium]|nr:NADH-quinone oxidoreductase subunit J [Piscirickettsiaceae bacterium]
MQHLIFYSFASILLFTSMMVIIVRNPVRAALCLVLSFFTSAAIWLFLEAEFLAITLVLVYVGAVMVLFLFVVMMLDIAETPLQEGFTRYFHVGIFVAFVITIEMIAVLGASHFGLGILPSPIEHPEGYSNTKALGRLLYTIYVYPFEISAVILTVAIVAAITLTLRKKKRKTQDPADQIKVCREDRIRIVKMSVASPQKDNEEVES